MYLGSLGYCLELALRAGVQHSALETQYNLERALPMAATLVATPLLVRADSGFCSLKLMQLDGPVRHKAKRPRIKTVMQDVMFKAGRMIRHAGRRILGMGQSDPAFAVFERRYAELRAA